MNKQHTGEQNPAAGTSAEGKTPASDAHALTEAIQLVNGAIAAKQKQFETIAETEEQDPILLEGETRTGYPVRVMADPKVVAKIMLEYDYPMYSVLNEDAPVGMWNELARLFGLDNVFSADI